MNLNFNTKDLENIPVYLIYQSVICCFGWCFHSFHSRIALNNKNLSYIYFCLDYRLSFLFYFPYFCNAWRKIKVNIVEYLFWSLVLCLRILGHYLCMDVCIYHYISDFNFICKSIFLLIVLLHLNWNEIELLAPVTQSVSLGIWIVILAVGHVYKLYMRWSIFSKPPSKTSLKSCFSSWTQVQTDLEVYSHYCLNTVYLLVSQHYFNRYL